METNDCPRCGDGCWRDEADVGVGIIYGPWGCPSCGWSEDPKYDRSNATNDDRQDQFGGWHPKDCHCGNDFCPEIVQQERGEGVERG